MYNIPFGTHTHAHMHCAGNHQPGGTHGSLTKTGDAIPSEPDPNTHIPSHRASVWAVGRCPHTPSLSLPESDISGGTDAQFGVVSPLVIDRAALFVRGIFGASELILSGIFG